MRLPWLLPELRTELSRLARWYWRHLTGPDFGERFLFAFVLTLSVALVIYGIYWAAK